MKTRIVTTTIKLEIETDKPLDKIVPAITKGLYRGLDSEPNYIAPPKNVGIQISDLKEITPNDFII
mgnify:CR=1 FL=1